MSDTQIFKEFMRKGSPIILQRLIHENGKILCHCIIYGGSNKYYTTEREIYAYCEGRGWLKREENPYSQFNSEIYLNFDYYNIIQEYGLDQLEYGSKKVVIKRVSFCFKRNEKIIFDLYCFEYRKKRIYFDTIQEVYAFFDGKFRIQGSRYQSPNS